MKHILLLLITFLTLTCTGQETNQRILSLTISPVIDTAEKTNQAIIKTLKEFLKTKNASLTENKYWLPSDFQKYIYPYFDIYDIENSKFGTDFYRPTLTELIRTENPTQKIIKISFIGHNSVTNENQLKLIYNIIANVSKDEVRLSRYLDYATQSWLTVNRNSLTYKISPNKTASETEMTNQQKDIEKICRFFKCNPIPIIYYSCINPKEVFEIKGFDYHPMMYVEKTGGLADFGNIIFSGNNSEIYSHEIVHIYTNSLFPHSNKFLNEGIATYLAGSGKSDYAWHRNKLKKFLLENKEYNLAGHIDPFERIYFESETSIPYLSAALISERTMRIYGQDTLIELFTSTKDFWTTLKAVGLTKENMNEELRREVNLPLTSVWQYNR